MGGPVAAALVAEVALRLFENGAAMLLAVDGTLYPGHRELLSSTK